MVPYATVRADGTFHRIVTEQLTLDLDMPSPGPMLVVTVEAPTTVSGESDRPSTETAISVARLGEVLAQVLDFHQAFDLPREPLPTSHVGDSLAQLRVRLLREEVEEFAEATERRDLVAIADALADVVYVAYGSAVTYGIDLDEVVREVHRSNMSKLDGDGRPVLREDGKVLKSQRYRPPDIGRVVGDQLPLFGPDAAAGARNKSVAAG
ncbi:MAG: MazG nucleotide pyrophosphohydrolase [Aeromicrobium sp.]|nr:MazG nucleotide pyrophosphohydrolase [Aeromicrobium sp.]